MPFTPVTTLDPETLKNAEQTLCDVFGVHSLYPHQVQARQNILQGITTLLDIPTGGGKTLASGMLCFTTGNRATRTQTCKR